MTNSKSDNQPISTQKMMTRHLLVQTDLEKKGIFVVISVFLFFGISDLFSQIYIGELIKLADPNLNIQLPDPTYYDVFRSVFTDFMSMGILIAIFFGIRAFASEISVEKQIHFFLSRPITRKQYYLTKAIIRGVALFVSIFLTSFIVYLLAMIYLDPIDLNLILGGAFIISLGIIANFFIVLMFNAKFSSGTTGLLSGLFFVIQVFIGTLTGFVDWLQWFSPMGLSGIWSNILINNDFSQLLGNSIGLLIWILLPLMIGTFLYDNRDL